MFDLALEEGVVAENVVRRVNHRGQPGSTLCGGQPQRSRRSGRWPTSTAWRLTLCGLRRSEVLGLRWSDLDLDGAKVKVGQARVALTPTQSVIDEVKSGDDGAAWRDVPVAVIQPGTVAALRALRVHQAEERLAAGWADTDSGLVVVDELGDPLRPE